MSIKEDLEKTILDSYEIIKQNRYKIPSLDPQDRSRLQKQIEENWERIEDALPDYASVCELRKLVPLEDILLIAAARFPDLFKRLEAAGQIKASMAFPAPLTSPNEVPPVALPLSPYNGTMPLQMSYKFVHPYTPINNEHLAQFTVKFGIPDANNILQDNAIIAHVCLVLDVSGSMNDPGKYPAILRAIQVIVNRLRDKDKLSIIIFSTNSELIWSDSIANARLQTYEIIQRIERSPIKFGGNTLLASGLRKAIDICAKNAQQATVTRLYILTDGQLHDVDQCLLFNTELRQQSLEVNSYGFGSDFDNDTMRRIMDGCVGARLKWVSNTEAIWESFQHIGAVAQNIVATNAELELTFSPATTLGDAFRFEPGTYWFKTMDDHRKRFHTHIGAIEKQRDYIYAFEALVYPSQAKNEKIARVTLTFFFQEKKQSITQDVLLSFSNKSELLAEKDTATDQIFKVLKGLRSNDSQTQKESFEARLELLRMRGGDIAQIQLLERALAELSKKGSITSFSEREMDYLEADPSSTHADPPRYYREN